MLENGVMDGNIGDEDIDEVKTYICERFPEVGCFGILEIVIL